MVEHLEGEMLFALSAPCPPDPCAPGVRLFYFFKAFENRLQTAPSLKLLRFRIRDAKQ